jgi:hypothetical protein
MRFSLRDWVHRRRSQRKRQYSKKAKALAACLTVCLATAWPSAAEAVSIQLAVTPTETMTQSFALYYIINSCSFWFATAVALGILPGGQTSVFVHDFPNRSLIDPGGGSYAGQTTPGWAIVGVHGPSEDQGVTIGFQNDQPIQDGATWDTFIRPALYNYSEETMISGLLGEFPGFPAENYALTAAHSSLRSMIQLPFGETATLINFSEASFAGTATATVPEPGTSLLLVTAAGLLVLMAWRRR